MNASAGQIRARAGGQYSGASITEHHQRLIVPGSNKPESPRRPVCDCCAIGQAPFRSSAADLPVLRSATMSIGDLLILAKIIEPGALDGADMHENIPTSVIGLDEAKALLGIEPLHFSLRHAVELVIRRSLQICG